MNKTVGFIGSGNMGAAMISGILSADSLLKPEQIIVKDLDENKLSDIKNRFGVNVTTDSSALLSKSDIIVLAVKPDIYDIVLREILPLYEGGKIIVTIAAGRTIKSVEAILGESAKIVRTMPNTPALVGEGMTVICPNGNVTQEEVAEIKQLFDSFGKSEILPEKMVDAVTGISGSSPAYTFMFIEALADAGVMAGMPRDKSYVFAAQAVLGAAKMVIETGKHPGELKDMVCSPGGTTIEAVSVLEACRFRGSVIEAAQTCIEKSKKLGGN